MDLKLKTLTPLHIGNGEEMHSLDYVVYGNLFYRVSERTFQMFLTKVKEKIGQEEARALVTKFAEWTLELTEQIENLRDQMRRTRDRRDKLDYNQQLVAYKKQFNYRGFLKGVNREDDFLKFLKDENIKGVAFGSNEDLKQQVRGMIRTGKGAAYLPGSSLKGAIRTALFYHVLENHVPLSEIEAYLNHEIRKVQSEKSDAEKYRKRFNVTGTAKRFGEKLVYDVFYCERIDSRERTIINDEMLDLCKLLLVSDSYPKDNKETVENIDSYLVSKQLVRQQRGRMNFIAERQKQPPSVEAIAEGQEITEAHLNFNVEFLYNLKHITTNNNGNVYEGKDKVWVGIEEKVEQLFGLKMSEFCKLSDLQKMTDKERTKYFKSFEDDVINRVISHVRRFSQKQLERSREWIANFAEHDQRGSFGSKMEHGFEQIMKRGNGNLINLGYASGFDATTVFYYLLDNQKPQLKEIMELFGIGDKPGADRNRRHGQTYKANPDNFPKSRRLISRRNEILPMGWLEITGGPEVPKEERSAIIDETEVPAAPIEPRFLRGKLKSGVILDGEIVSVGKPNTVKLFITEGNLQTVDVSYGAGFDTDKIGTLIEVKAGSVTKKGQVLSGTFKGFRS